MERLVNLKNGFFGIVAAGRFSYSKITIIKLHRMLVLFVTLQQGSCISSYAYQAATNNSLLFDNQWFDYVFPKREPEKKIDGFEDLKQDENKSCAVTSLCFQTEASIQN